MPLLWFPILIWLGLQDSFILALLWSILCTSVQGLIFKIEKFRTSHTREEELAILLIPIEQLIRYRMLYYK